MSGLIEHFRAMALNNACSNLRLLDACCKLTDAEFAAERTSFFPSLLATLNHILLVDRYYLRGLRGELADYSIFADETPYATPAALQEEQAASDRNLIAFCDRLEAGDLAREVRLDRGERGIDVETVGTVLPHLFVHQIHHRGQAHAMLAGTPVAPPQLDEFFLRVDAGLRAADVAALQRMPAR